MVPNKNSTTWLESLRYRLVDNFPSEIHQVEFGISTHGTSSESMCTPLVSHLSSVHFHYGSN